MMAASRQPPLDGRRQAANLGGESLTTAEAPGLHSQAKLDGRRTAADTSRQGGKTKQQTASNK